jgi:CRP/FNR family transcriptional regulator, cyclic AMP receptor protein
VIEGVSMEEERWPLAKVDILEPLSPEEIERLALLPASVHLGAGDAFALEEGRCALLLLTSGRVRVHEPNAAGPGLTLSLVENPTVVTQTGFAAWLPRVVLVEAFEPSVLRVLEGEAFDDLVRRNPEVGVKTIRVLGERLFTCEGRLSDMVRKEVPARLASLILGLSEHQGVVPANGSRMIPTRYTHNQLASMVGSNRVALTKALGRPRRAGGVEVKDRRIHGVDVDVLTRIAGSGR